MNAPPFPVYKWQVWGVSVRFMRGEVCTCWLGGVTCECMASPGLHTLLRRWSTAPPVTRNRESLIIHWNWISYPYGNWQLLLLLPQLVKKNKFPFIIHWNWISYPYGNWELWLLLLLLPPQPVKKNRFPFTIHWNWISYPFDNWQLLLLPQPVKKKQISIDFPLKLDFSPLRRIWYLTTATTTTTTTTCEKEQISIHYPLKLDFLPL